MAIYNKRILVYNVSNLGEPKEIQAVFQKDGTAKSKKRGN